MRIIAGRWRGHGIKAPKGSRVRPTTDRVREAWMSALGADMIDATVLDLFAGSGALGLECLSRGAKEVTFVERARGSLDVLGQNVHALGAESLVTVVRGDALGYVRRLGEGDFDLALADPPYEVGLAAALVEAFRATPFARALWVEHRTGEALPDAPRVERRAYGDTTLSTYTCE